MNRRLVKEGVAYDDTYERTYKCDPCGFFFIVSVQGRVKDKGDLNMAFEHEVHAMNEYGWCPCRPWNVDAVQVGMKLPEGWVLGLNRETGMLTLGESLSADMQSTVIVPFDQVSPPQ